MCQLAAILHVHVVQFQCNSDSVSDTSNCAIQPHVVQRLHALFQVTNYLLDATRILDDEVTYKQSLEIEPRTARVSAPVSQSTC